MKMKRFLTACSLILLSLVLVISVGVGLASKTERVGLDGEVRPWTIALATIYVRAAWMNDANSQYLLGRYEIDWEQDGDAALSWFRRAAASGNAEAIAMVSLLEKKREKPKGDDRASGER
jgi:hypothetical protein